MSGATDMTWSASKGGSIYSGIEDWPFGMIKIIVINPNEARYVLAGILTLLICCLGLQLLINKPSLHLLLSTNHLGVDQDRNTFICYPSTGGVKSWFQSWFNLSGRKLRTTSNQQKTPLKGPNQTTSGPQISKQYGGGNSQLVGFGIPSLCWAVVKKNRWSFSFW